MRESESESERKFSLMDRMTSRVWETRDLVPTLLGERNTQDLYPVCRQVSMFAVARSAERGIIPLIPSDFLFSLVRFPFS